MKCLAFLSFFLFLLIATSVRGNNVPMPWEVHYFSITTEGKKVRMAYMDVPAKNPNGKTVLLLHGKNFNGWYWRPVVKWLAARGYRVIVPDQLGFGNSDHPNIHYSFHLLASNTHKLLGSLQVPKVTVIGHSMGGMLATRFTLLYPDVVTQLILENPIGLEDYRLIVPYSSTDEQFKKEQASTFTSYKNYQKSYFPEWKPEYDSLVIIQAAALKAPNFNEIAWANALTYEMIYQQPVCYEFPFIKVPTLLIIGQADRTIVGKATMPEAEQMKYGQYPLLGRQTAALIKGAKLVELPGVGHIPHVQDFDRFAAALNDFLK